MSPNLAEQVCSAKLGSTDGSDIKNEYARLGRWRYLVWLLVGSLNIDILSRISVVPVSGSRHHVLASWVCLDELREIYVTTFGSRTTINRES